MRRAALGLLVVSLLASGCFEGPKRLRTAIEETAPPGRDKVGCWYVSGSDVRENAGCVYFVHGDAARVAAAVARRATGAGYSVACLRTRSGVEFVGLNGKFRISGVITSGAVVFPDDASELRVLAAADADDDAVPVPAGSMALKLRAEDWPRPPLRSGVPRRLSCPGVSSG